MNARKLFTTILLTLAFGLVLAAPAVAAPPANTLPAGLEYFYGEDGLTPVDPASCAGNSYGTGCFVAVGYHGSYYVTSTGKIVPSLAPGRWTCSYDGPGGSCGTIVKGTPLGQAIKAARNQ